MKKKYSLTVANSQIDIVTEENKETIDTVVGIVDRKIREVYLHSKGECSRTNAAILVCLDYCAERLELQKTLRNLNSEIERLTAINELVEREKTVLEREIEILRANVHISTSPKATPKKVVAEQIAFDDISVDESPADDGAQNLPVNEPVVAEKLTPPTEEVSEKPHVKLKKKKVRAMFDNIAFDEI